MIKLVNGVVDFGKNVRPGYVEMFGKLALGQRPDTLFVACSDSRVVPNTFASSDPGDLFVIRNVGNIVPPPEVYNNDPAPTEAAALEFALERLGVSEVIVCGHSECGAMQAVLAGTTGMSHLDRWLTYASKARNEEAFKIVLDPSLSAHNKISQLNILLQLEHIASYPFAAKLISDGKLRLHGWYFDLSHAEVYSFEPDVRRFCKIDEILAPKIIRRLEGK